MSETYPFDPTNLAQLELLGKLPAQRRILLMLEAHELAVGLIRGRLHRSYPDISSSELNLKVLEEVERANK